jgi:Rad52/22 family double-strand break repair protein
MTHTLPQHEIRPLTDVQLKTLMADLNPDRVASLAKGRTSLSYLETWDVKATLIRVFGFGGFSAEADECEIVKIEDNVPKVEWVNKEKRALPIEYAPDGQIAFGTANFRVNVRVRVKLTIHQLGAVYTEWAACSQTGPDLGEVTDFAIKTAESDALKRAAIYLGTQFGLSLYNNGSTEEVVKTIVEPGQSWRRGARWDPEAAAVMGAIVDGRPVSAGESVAHLKPEGSSDQQHQQNMANLNASLSAQVARQEHRGGPDVPLALDPTLSVSRSSDPVSMDPDYGGDGGKSEGAAYDNA